MAETDTDLVVGADVGGTSTRVAAATLAGEVVALASAPGGNPNAVGLQTATERIRDTALRCLAGVGPGAAGSVRSMVVGLAGGNRAAADRGFLARITPPGSPVTARLVGDLEIAFASATPAGSGCVLVAGTGAIAGRILDHVLISRRDGWGWLLGDEGAGWWLGREAVRGTLAALETGRALGPLHTAVLAAAAATDADTLIGACYRQPPIWLASLAELVREHPEDPDTVAIAHAAADHLEALLARLAPAPTEPIVVAGSVVTAPGPVGTELASRWRRRHPGQVVQSSTGLVGALWIARRDCGPAGVDVHRRLVDSAAARAPGPAPRPPA